MNVVSFYRFVDIENPQQIRDSLHQLCEQQELLGTVLVAEEGINGTLAGEQAALQTVLSWFTESLNLTRPVEGRWTVAAEAPFRRLRIKLKKEIVTMGVEHIRAAEMTGQHVSAEEWNALISNPETLVIDTRNQYEYELGTFSNAVDPGTQSFREFPAYAKSLADSDKARPVAMFCTGGIRCEKATALMLELGFKDVFQLEGGILKYLEDVESADSLWSGECFVFDTRVALDQERNEGAYQQCHGCRRPLGKEELASPDYHEGISCPRCIDSLDEHRKERLAERLKQVKLAQGRKMQHIGAVLPAKKTDCSESNSGSD